MRYGDWRIFEHGGGDMLLGVLCMETRMFFLELGPCSAFAQTLYLREIYVCHTVLAEDLRILERRVSFPCMSRVVAKPNPSLVQDVA